MARLECQFSVPTARECEADYIHEVVIDVLQFNETITEEHLIGRLLISKVECSDAELDGRSLFHICDDDSQGLYEVHRILTEGSENIRDDLDVDEPFDHILFVYRFVLHPDFSEHRRAILETALEVFGWQALVVMWKNEGDFPENELASLGFRRISREELIYRHSSWQTQFNDDYPQGQSIEEAATPDHEAWVLQQQQIDPEE